VTATFQGSSTPTKRSKIRTDRQVCFDTLQIVELYETVAVQALYAARTVAARMGGARATTQAVVIAPYVEAVGRVACNRP
jgi:hypothetical protein